MRTEEGFMEAGSSETQVYVVLKRLELAAEDEGGGTAFTRWTSSISAVETSASFIRQEFICRRSTCCRRRA
jgi:hypothetical protein